MFTPAHVALLVGGEVLTSFPTEPVVGSTVFFKGRTWRYSFNGTWDVAPADPPVIVASMSQPIAEPIGSFWLDLS